MKHQDRGGRSPEGMMRDDFRNRWGRAKALGWSSVLDRWDNDDKDDYLFRRNLMGEGWSREDIKRVDEVACSEGKPVPKRGDGTGRSADERYRYEGEYQRVSVSGALPETERDPAQIPHYVHQRNARRKAESAYWRGEMFEGPGAEGFGETGKEKGKGKDAAKHSNVWSESRSATWWAAAGSTWWDANAAAPGKPEQTSFDYSFYLVIITIFACGAVLGGVIGYLIAYIKYEMKKKTRTGRTVAQQTIEQLTGDRSASLDPWHRRRPRRRAR